MIGLASTFVLAETQEMNVSPPTADPAQPAQNEATPKTTAGNSDANNLDSLLDGMKDEMSDVKLVYEYECTLSENYVVPEEVFGELNKLEFEKLAHGREGENGEVRWSSKRVKKGTKMVDARALMYELAKMQYRTTGNKDKVKKMLEAAATVGAMTSDKEGVYVGPLQLCLIEAAARLQFRKDERARGMHPRSFLGDIAEGEREINGTYEGDSDLPQFTYTTEMTREGGLPSKVKCRVDFTSSKAILLKKESKD